MPEYLVKALIRAPGHGPEDAQAVLREHLEGFEVEVQAVYPFVEDKAPLQSAAKAGLYDKFVVLKDGRPVRYPTFTLRTDGTDEAAIEALRAYAMASTDSKLVLDLNGIISREGHPLPTAVWELHYNRVNSPEVVPRV